MSDPGTDWQIDKIVSVTDGDTVRLVRRRTTHLEGLRVDVTDSDPKGVSVRLITLDTPERGDNGWAQAADDVRLWLFGNTGRMSVTTWPDGGFGRHLGDIYVTGDRSNTLSQWMIRERGWLPYVKGT